MKRYILMILSLILVVASFITMSESTASKVVAGAGDKDNAQIENFKKLEGVLNLAYYGDSDYDDYFDSDYEDEDEKTYTYDTLTMHEDVSGNSTVTSTGDSKQVTRFSGSYSYYIGKKDTYRVMKGMYSSSYEDYQNGHELTEVNCVFDIEFYEKDSKYYVKVNAFLLKKNGHDKVDMSDIFGQWLKVDEEVYSSFEYLISNYVVSSLSDMRQLVMAGKEEFKRSGDVYSIEESESVEGYSYDSNVSVDLSAPETPALSYKVSLEGNNSHTKLKDFITFSNIDNTVIEIDLKNVGKLSMDDFEDFVKED